VGVTDIISKPFVGAVPGEFADEPAMRTVPVRKIDAGELRSGEDRVAIEEPLEIRLSWPMENIEGLHSDIIYRNVAVTMRTPGDDEKLALGFLFTEGIIRSPDQVAVVSASSSVGNGEDSNQVTIQLQAAPEFELSKLDRNFYVTSSCGVCGKASIDAIRTHAQFPVKADDLQISAEALVALPQQLVTRQRVFAGTGSIHAAALFGVNGLLGPVYEDVGRHNAVDKLVGAHFEAGELPLRSKAILVSGRASFELVQKARMAGCAMLAAVGAPSSLAIDLAWDSDMTLIGFLRDGRFNIYTGPARVSSA
jgi:FdhD protein